MAQKPKKTALKNTTVSTFVANCPLFACAVWIDSLSQVMLTLLHFWNCQVANEIWRQPPSYKPLNQMIIQEQESFSHCSFYSTSISTRLFSVYSSHHTSTRMKPQIAAPNPLLLGPSPNEGWVENPESANGKLQKNARGKFGTCFFPIFGSFWGHFQSTLNLIRSLTMTLFMTSTKISIVIHQNSMEISSWMPSPFFPQQRKLMGSSAQISSGVCRCGSQEQVPEEGSGRFRVCWRRFRRQVPEGSGGFRCVLV